MKLRNAALCPRCFRIVVTRCRNQSFLSFSEFLEVVSVDDTAAKECRFWVEEVLCVGLGGEANNSKIPKFSVR
jgi:hypothetical protein